MNEAVPPLADWNACEYNPQEKRAAYENELHAVATWIVGCNGKWRLCDACAALPEFKRLRKRSRITWRLEAVK